jgi:hypothetical protein
VLPETISSSSIFKHDYDADKDVIYANFIKTIMDKGIVDEQDFFRGKSVREVSTFQLFPTREDLKKERIQELLNSDWSKEKEVLALKDGDKYYVVSGHNRAATEILLSKSTIKVKVHEI